MQEIENKQKKFKFDYVIPLISNLIILYLIIFGNINILSFVFIVLIEMLFRLWSGFILLRPSIKTKDYHSYQIIHMFIFMNCFIGLVLTIIFLGSSVRDLIINSVVVLTFIILANSSYFVWRLTKKESLSVNDVTREYYYLFVEITGLLIIGYLFVPILGKLFDIKAILIIIVLGKIFADFAVERINPLNYSK
jgi:hypothetical protein